MARRSNSASVGALILLLAAIALAYVVISFVLTWPYQLGARLAVEMGAAAPSGARSALGWVFESVYLLLLAGALGWVLYRRSSQPPKAPAFDHTAAKHALDVIAGRVPGWSDDRIPASERVLMSFSGITLVEPRSRNGQKVPTGVATGELLITTKNARFLGPDGRNKAWTWAKVTGMPPMDGFVQINVSTRATHCGVAFPASLRAVGESIIGWSAAKALGATGQQLESYAAGLREHAAAAKQATAEVQAHPGPPRLSPRVLGMVGAAVAVTMVASTGVTAIAINVGPEAPGVVAAEERLDAVSGADQQLATPAESVEASPTTESSAPVEEASPGTETVPLMLAGSGNGEEVDKNVRIGLTKTTALAALDDLEVKGRAPKTGYDRDEFGPRWADVDRNGCDTRNDILARDLTYESFKEATHHCVVLSGILDDPYTGTSIPFQRGQDTSTAVQIDHVVALSDAWQKGAQKISEEDRERFANDPLNLLAVDGPTNAAKGDGDAATWLPPNKAFRCQYVARQVAVKKTYKLWVTKAEKQAMKRVLTSCDDVMLPKGGLRPKVTVVAAVDDDDDSIHVAPEPEPVREPEPEPEPVSVYYQNCTAARSAGAAPVYVGEPGYGSHLDRDGDGVGCE